MTAQVLQAAVILQNKAIKIQIDKDIKTKVRFVK